MQADPVRAVSLRPVLLLVGGPYSFALPPIRVIGRLEADFSTMRFRFFALENCEKPARINLVAPAFHTSSKGNEGDRRQPSLSQGVFYKEARDGAKKGPRVPGQEPGAHRFWQRPTLAPPRAALPSGLRRFTAVFGMGTGGATALGSPEPWRRRSSARGTAWPQLHQNPGGRLSRPYRQPTAKERARGRAPPLAPAHREGRAERWDDLQTAAQAFRGISTAGLARLAAFTPPAYRRGRLPRPFQWEKSSWDRLGA